MARPKRQDVDEAAPVAPSRRPWVRIKVTHYKIFTSQGRAIQGQFIELPAEEAEAFIAKGHAVAT
jgi:hypothetical protein